MSSALVSSSKCRGQTRGPTVVAGVGGWKQLGKWKSDGIATFLLVHQHSTALFGQEGPAHLVRSLRTHCHKTIKSVKETPEEPLPDANPHPTGLLVKFGVFSIN